MALEADVDGDPAAVMVEGHGGITVRGRRHPREFRRRTGSWQGLRGVQEVAATAAPDRPAHPSPAHPTAHSARCAVGGRALTGTDAAPIATTSVAAATTRPRPAPGHPYADATRPASIGTPRTTR